MVRGSISRRRYGIAYLLIYGLVLAFTWLTAAYFFLEFSLPDHWKLVITWALMSALGTLLILGLLGFFDVFRYMPQKRNLVTLTLTAPVGAVVAKYFLFTLRGIPVVRYREILWVTPLVAVMAYFYQYAIWLYIRRKKICIRVLAAITDEQQERLRAATRNRNKLAFVKFIPLSQLDHITSAEVEKIDWIVYSRIVLRDLKSDLLIVKEIVSGLPAVEWRQFLMQLTQRVDLDIFDTWTFVQYLRRGGAYAKLYAGLKFLIEPPIALLLIVVLSPLFLLIFFMVPMDSPGPAIFTQNRTGKRGKNFKLYKFRTMFVRPEENPNWTAEHDPRVSRLGAFLRQSRLDELPQLFNVLRGQMSFIGPRPERPEFYAQFENRIPLFSMRTAINPGITGWAQVNHGYTASLEESAVKLEYDLYYILHRSLWLDIAIIFNTFSLLYRGGAGR
jgi:lipopolysaccharide/colanic/teichoic acid biosynthesis glycosyltransferase